MMIAAASDNDRSATKSAIQFRIEREAKRSRGALLHSALRSRLWLRPVEHLDQRQRNSWHISHQKQHSDQDGDERQVRDRGLPDIRLCD